VKRWDHQRGRDKTFRYIRARNGLNDRNERRRRRWDASRGGERRFRREGSNSERWRERANCDDRGDKTRKGGMTGDSFIGR